jgi:hypothetical protein
MLSALHQSCKGRQIQIPSQLPRPMTSIAILPKDRPHIMKIANHLSLLLCLADNSGAKQQRPN